MGDISSILGLILALLAGGPNDLLDYIPTDAYWKQQHVQVSASALITSLKGDPVGDISRLISDLGATDYKVRDAAQEKLIDLGPAVISQLQKATAATDAEVANRAQQIIDHLQGGGTARAVRRLMAIRTLGEMKDKDAVAVLTPLLQSKVPFEADYAAAALAAIAGRTYSRPQPDTKALAADLALLPEGLDFIGQAAPGRFSAAATTQPAGAATPAAMAAKMMATVATLRQTPEIAQQQVINILITAAQSVGNVRFDAVTIGSAVKAGGDPPEVTIVVLRGQYDHQKTPAAISQALSGFFGGLLARNDPAPPPQGVDGIPCLNPDVGVGTALFPDDQRLVLIVGPSRLDAQAVKDMAAALKAGHATIGLGQAPGGLLKNTDTTKPVWAVTRFDEDDHKEPILAPFETASLGAEASGSDIQLTLKAQGTDAAKVKVAAQAAVSHIASRISSLDTGVAAGAIDTPGLAQAMRPLLASLKSLQIRAEGTTATATGTLFGATQTLVLVPLADDLIDQTTSNATTQPATTQPGQ